MMSSVTSSYLPPPMPWMNSSATNRRANSVVVRARVRILQPAAARMRREVAPQARPSRVADAQLQVIAMPLSPQPLPAQVAVAPEPEGCLQPIAVATQIGHGMKRTAQFVPPAIFPQRRVVGGVKARQIVHHVQGEPNKRLGFT